MPENIVYMYYREMLKDDILTQMSKMLEVGGEEAIKKLPETHPVRVQYLKARKYARELELAEHEEIMKHFGKRKGKRIT